MENNEILKKQIIYRSMHRGTKEMDILLSGFVKKYINTFTETELQDLLKLLQIDDEIIYKWYFEKGFKLLIPSSRVSLLLKKFKL